MNRFRLTTSLLLACALAGGSYALTRKGSRVKVYPPIKVMTPQIGDTLGAPHRYKAEQLLGSVEISNLQGEGKTTDVDSAGFVSFNAPATDALVEILSTSIRPERYMKGKLKVTAAQRFEILVDNESKAIKSTVQDSITDASAQTVDLTLEPEWVHEITVKYLNEKGAKAKPAVRIEFIPEKKFEDVAFALDPELKKRFNVRNLTDGVRVLSTSVSPDGKYVLCRYSETFSAKEKRYRATLFDTKTGKAVSTNLNYSCGWLPSGSTLYYLTPRKGDFNDIVSMTLPAMTTSVLASNVPANNITWSPDGTYFIYSKGIEGKVDKGVMKKYDSPDDRIPGNRYRSYLVKYDLKSKTSQPLTYGGETTSLCDINPDGSKIIYSVQKQTPAKYPFYYSTLIEMDVNTLKTDTLINSDGFLNDAVYSPDGKRLFVLGGPEAFNGLGVNAGNHPIPNAFDVQGYLYDIATHKATAVTKDFDPSIKGRPVWNKADGKIYFRAYEGFNTPVYCFNPVKSTFTKLPFSIESIQGFSMGRNESQWLSCNGQGYSYAGKAELMNLKTMKATVLDDPYGEDLSKTNLGKTEPWKFTASDGTVIDGMMCLPPDFDANKKYPLIVYYYGGTTPSDKGISHSYSPQLFASRDYVVYVINPSGTIGYGQEYSARHVNAWGKRTANDIIEGVKEFCRQHPYVDEKKIGCLGASYGGFMTQYLQTQTDIFAAAVSHAGISNVTSYWGEGFWGYSYNSVAAAQSYPWTDPELYTKQGSLFNADKIKTPLLLLHGTEDTNVPIGESIQLFNALRVLGRDVEFITVEGQNHVITDYDKRILWHATIMAWFAKYLQDDARWWDALYKK